MKTPDTTPNRSKIQAALQPSFDALKAACLSNLKRKHDAMIEQLEAHNWDLTAAYPILATRAYSGDKYRLKQEQQTANWAARAITDCDRAKDKYGHGGSVPGSSMWRVVKPDLAAKRDDEAAGYAQDFINAYAAKLTAKVASVDKAYDINTVQYTGTADPFSMSKLTVTGSGETMVWNTRCILNVSKLGKLFNQWPTRKAK